jgi:hypothetical protein
MDRIKENKQLLDLISKCKNRNERKVFLEKGSDEFIKAILEILLNVAKGNVNITDKIKKKLKKYKRIIRMLICPKVSLKLKRQTLIQKGGFLNVILPAVIGGVLSYIFEKKK